MTDTDNKWRRLQPDKIKKIQSQLRAGAGVRELARLHGVHPSTITLHGKGIISPNAHRRGMLGNSNARKFTDEQEKEIQLRHDNGETEMALVEELGICKATLRRICKK